MCGSVQKPMCAGAQTGGFARASMERVKITGRPAYGPLLQAVAHPARMQLTRSDRMNFLTHFVMGCAPHSCTAA